MHARAILARIRCINSSAEVRRRHTEAQGSAAPLSKVWKGGRKVGEGTSIAIHCPSDARGLAGTSQFGISKMRKMFLQENEILDDVVFIGGHRRP